MNDNLFDDIIKQKLNDQTYEFAPSDWSAFEAKQNATPKASPSNLKWWIGGAAAVTIISIGLYTWLSPNTAKSGKNEDNATVESKTIVNAESNELSSLETDIEEQSENLVNKNIETPEKQLEAENHKNDHSSVTSNHTIEATENSEPTNSDKDNSNIIIAGDPLESVNASPDVAIPSAAIISGKLEVCIGESVSFETIEQENVSYSWSFGDNNFSSERLVSHEYRNAGTYTVSLIVTSTKDHNVLSKSKDVTVDVSELPNTKFDYAFDFEAPVTTVNFTPESPNQNFIWNFGDGTTSKENNPSKSYPKKGYYVVTLKSTSHNGCVSETSNKLTIKEDYNLLAPNSFTPNGDGINDYFIPEALKTMDCSFTMTIYSKADGLIFESKNINQQWDGNNQQNGNSCTEGTYIWIVSLITKEGKSEQYKGAVLLLK